MLIKHFDKYYTEKYYENLLMYGSPPPRPLFTLGPFPTPPRENHLPLCLSFPK